MTPLDAGRINWAISPRAVSVHNWVQDGHLRLFMCFRCVYFFGKLCVCESTFLEIYLFKNCPEGKICGKFLKKRQKCTSSKVGFDQKLR